MAGLSIITEEQELQLVESKVLDGILYARGKSLKDASMDDAIAVLHDTVGISCYSYLFWLEIAAIAIIIARKDQIEQNG